MTAQFCRTVRYWTFPPKEAAEIAEALATHPGAVLRITPYEAADGNPQIRWSVIAETATEGGDPPGGNNSQVCPPVC